MIRTMMNGFTLAALLGGVAYAETHEVRMLNSGEAGIMIFEPATLSVAPGDTVKFLPTDRGHNAETVAGMIPEGADAFKGRIDEEIEVTLEAEGLYAVKCAPHFGLGMVMLIAVGDAKSEAISLDDFLAGRVPPKAKESFIELLAEF